MFNQLYSYLSQRAADNLEVLGDCPVPELFAPTRLPDTLETARQLLVGGRRNRETTNYEIACLWTALNGSLLRDDYRELFPTFKDVGLDTVLPLFARFYTPQIAAQDNSGNTRVANIEDYFTHGVAKFFDWSIEISDAGEYRVTLAGNETAVGQCGDYSGDLWRTPLSGTWSILVSPRQAQSVRVRLFGRPTKPNLLQTYGVVTSRSSGISQQVASSRSVLSDEIRQNLLNVIYNPPSCVDSVAAFLLLWLGATQRLTQ